MCRRCGEFYPSDMFKITSRKLSGKIYYKSTCANCIAEETSTTRALRKLHQPPKECECCGRVSRLVVDHCHSTGSLRGYLCQQCNVGLGNLGDNQAGLMRAIRYLCKDASPARREEWAYKQPPEPFPPFPSRGCFLGPSGSGKSTTLILSLIHI